jgi:acyl carrier protein
MATSQHEIAGVIETFIRRQFRIVSSDDGAPFSRDAHLFESGYVDSAGVVELIVFVESTFDVKLEDEHVFSEQFTTVNGISDIVMMCEAKPDELRAAVR